MYIILTQQHVSALKGPFSRRHFSWTEKPTSINLWNSIMQIRRENICYNVNISDVTYPNSGGQG